MTRLVEKIFQDSFLSRKFTIYVNEVNVKDSILIHGMVQYGAIFISVEPILNDPKQVFMNFENI